MRVVFTGFQTWGLVTLRALHAAGHEVALVITHPSPTDEHAQHFNESVAKFAEQRGLPVVICSAVSADVVRRVESLEPDVIVSSNWRRLLPSLLLRSAKHGGINIHRSMLPRYAGVAPINWAVANGETKSGVTIHMMTDEFDMGDIVVQEALPIGPAETATDIFHKTTPIVERLVVEALTRLDSGTVQLIKQDAAQAEFFHPRGDKELRIDWAKTNVEIYNLIRAQSDPFANAFTSFEGKRLKIKTAALPDRRYRGTPGRVCERLPDGGVIVICGGGSPRGQGLILKTVQLEDRPACNADKAFPRMGCYLDERPLAAVAAARNEASIVSGSSLVSLF